MARQHSLERYEATEGRDLTRLLRALRPPEHEVPVAHQVDLAIRAEIWKPQVQRQVITLLAMARPDLIHMTRQALTGNPLLEAALPTEVEHTRGSEAYNVALTASVDELTKAAERYNSIWQACMADGWDGSGPASQAPDMPDASAGFSSPPEPLLADVIITKVGDDYQVAFNDEGMPRLRLKPTYRQMVREAQAHGAQARQSLDDQLRAAVWLIRSLAYRRQRLCTMAQFLVTRQRAFLDHGLPYIQPLTLMELATALGMHASTLQCLVTNKYLATVHGIVALTAFFHSGIESSGDDAVSSLTVKNRLQALIAAEDPSKPLTDQQLVEALAAERIRIARRTVTAYRRELNLPSASHRQPQGSTAGASRLSPDEEQRLHRILATPASLPAYRAWLEGRSPAPDPVGEMRMAYRDLQVALAHPLLRPAVLQALRAFAQAAQMSISLPPSVLERTPAEPVATDKPSSPPASNAIEPMPPQQEAAADRQNGLTESFMICQSPKMQEVVRRIERVLQTTATVLVIGEPGTGKGLVARILHEQGARREGPFMAVSCAGIPEMGLEAEIFDHLEWATGGTLFIDGVADMSPMLQAKLLRVLQEGRVARGEPPESYSARARIIAASTPALEQRVAAGIFRHDLYYRLNIYPITLPPLRERREDLRPLALHFLQRSSQCLGKEVQGISQEAMQQLERYSWPGNVQELAEVIEQAVVRCREPVITVQDLPQPLTASLRLPAGNPLADLEKTLIQQALEQAQGNKSQAAKVLGLSRSQLCMRMQQYGLEG